MGYLNSYVVFTSFLGVIGQPQIKLLRGQNQGTGIIIQLHKAALIILDGENRFIVSHISVAFIILCLQIVDLLTFPFSNVTICLPFEYLLNSLDLANCACSHKRIHTHTRTHTHILSLSLSLARALACSDIVVH